MEFIALANHRKSIKVEIAPYAERSRQLQVDAVSRALARYGFAGDEY
jgi:hypothetical protein